VIDRLPLQKLDSEQAVLGSALIDPAAIHALELLTPGDFHRQAHGLIVGAMTAQAALRVVLSLPRALPAARPGRRR
jgi:replicative DNA helicase